MCGISIVISLANQEVPESAIRPFNNKVSHRGPDDEGFYYGNNFAFGHRRLSILDLTQAGHQPMPWRHLWITYNGEIYNYLELREELKDRGYVFQSGTDTEVILAAYDAWGTDAFARFNGMWAFAIHDTRKDEIVFSRDHFGIKPLFYTQTENLFLAGSEIKQFTAIDEFKPSLNKTTAINFLVNGYTNYSEHTFFENVYELQGGYYLRYDLKTHSRRIAQWYDLAKMVKPVLESYDVATKRLRALFVDSVKLRMRSDVRVGSCLSGGIDSSSIVSVIDSHKMANGSFTTVTSCFDDVKYDEQKFSDLVTEKTGFNSSKVYPRLDDLWDKGHFDTMLYHQDQPFTGTSHYAEFNVFSRARSEGLIVMLDGQGADEYLCGYGEFWTEYLRELFFSFRWSQALQLMKLKAKHQQSSLFSIAKAQVLNPIIFKLKKPVKNFLGLEYSWMTSFWRKKAKRMLVRFSYSGVQDLSLLEIDRISIPFQLHSEDRNSMFSSVESRLPFLDPRLVEYCIGLPADFKIRGGFTKAIMRDAINELPEAIRNRKDKMGFVAPDLPWFLRNKKQIRTELAESIQNTGFFSEELLARFDKFTDGKLGYEPIYFRAIALNRFIQIFKMSV